MLGAGLRFLWILVVHRPFDHVYSDMAGYVGRGELIATGHALTRYDVFQATGTQTLLSLPFAIFGTGRAGSRGGCDRAVRGLAARGLLERLLPVGHAGAGAPARRPLAGDARHARCARACCRLRRRRPAARGVERDKGKLFRFPGTPVYDQGFFFRHGLDCIRRDGLGHVRVIADNLAALTATSVPWPAAEEPGFIHDTARAANIAYSALLAIILVATALVFRRGGGRELAQPLAHLATPFLVALFFIGEPRYRALYDVFGLVLAAGLLSLRASRPRVPAPAARAKASSPEAPPRRAPECAGP